jgi:hypothetical protein
MCPTTYPAIVAPIATRIISMSGSLISSKNGPSERDVEIWKAAFATDFRQTAIAFEVSEATVRDAYNRVEKAIASSQLVDPVAMKTRLHFEAESIKQEAMAAWQKTKGPRRQTKTKTKRSDIDDLLGEAGGDQFSTEQEIEVKEWEEAGDPRYLTIAQKSIDQQMELWPGVRAPRASSLTDPTGAESVVKIDVADLTDEQIAQILIGQQIARQVIDVE